MEDRRVIKTKKNLKATLIEMMGEISFEQISITELCKRAEISRITFYAHYSDKYALADDTNPSEPKYVHTKWGVGYYFQA